MPRQLRIQYPGVMYHVMSRGNRRESIFLDDVDRHDFLKTLAMPPCAGAYNRHSVRERKRTMLRLDPFSVSCRDKYRGAFLSFGTADLVSTISEIPALIPVFIENDTAQYRFEQVVQGRTLSFPVEFVKENGIWKIVEF